MMHIFAGVLCCDGTSLIYQIRKSRMLVSPTPFRECSVVQSSPALSHSMACSLPGSSVHGISQQEYWSGLPLPSPGDLSDPGIKPVSPILAGRVFTPEPPGTSHQIRLLLYDLLLTSYICDDPVSK